MQANSAFSPNKACDLKRPSQNLPGAIAENPLAHGLIRQDFIHKQRAAIRHRSRTATGTEASGQLKITDNWKDDFLLRSELIGLYRSEHLV